MKDAAKQRLEYHSMIQVLWDTDVRVFAEGGAAFFHLQSSRPQFDLR